jgi:predicted glycosyltransferase
LYSPGMVGLGHMRRNLLIAQVLASAQWQAGVLMVAEARQASAFAMPPRVDCLTLPALRKKADGRCKPRYLGISLQELVTLRARTIRAALEAFEPDVLIVDHLPRGAVNELDPTLESLRARGRTRCVLGLRDVLEDPATVRREWHQAANEDTIREHYDAIWVYGDPAVYDLVPAYRLPLHVAEKVRYTGYLDQRLRFKRAEDEGAELLTDLAPPPNRLMLCLVGGGQDGAHLAEGFAQADLPPDATGVIVAGPFMPPEVQRRLRDRAALNPRVRLVQFLSEPTVLLSRADRVVAMGGYNTVGEVLSFEKWALIVPRADPRPEQRIRAERLRDLGLLDVLHPNRVSPRALSEWLARDLGPPPRARDRIDLNGLARLPHLLAEVLAARSDGASSQLHERAVRRVAD